MNQISLATALYFFEPEGKFFGKFRSSIFDKNCLTMMEKPPIHLFGDWYYIRGMK